MIHLREGRNTVIVLRYVGVKYGAVAFCHCQRGMTKQLLERESIAAAIYEILAGKVWRNR